MLLSKSLSLGQALTKGEEGEISWMGNKHRFDYVSTEGEDEQKVAWRKQEDHWPCGLGRKQKEKQGPLNT